MSSDAHAFTNTMSPKAPVDSTNPPTISNTMSCTSPEFKHTMSSKEHVVFENTPTVTNTMSSEAPVAKAKQTVYICKYNCICTRKDCEDRHSIQSYEDRQFASQIYNFVPDIREHIKEDNMEKRKLNCIKGQLCQRSDCGFRHYLDFKGRQDFFFAMSVANFAKSKKKPLSDDEKSFKIAEMQQQIDNLEAKMQKVLSSLDSN